VPAYIFFPIVPGTGRPAMSIAFESEQLTSQKLRDRLRSMSDE
jgi:hypothetical protein